MKLFSRQYGDGDEALIILHGLLGSSANWRTLAKRFAQKRSVYTLDLRNHGQSPWSDTMHYQAMADDVAQFIDPLEHKYISLLGHSMGGKAAMQLALELPEKINTLIVADIAPVTYSHDYQQLIEALLAIDLSKVDKRAQADEALKAAIPETGIRAFLLHNLAFEQTQKRWSWRPNLKVLLANMENITGFDINAGKQFNKPTLFIHGAESDYVDLLYHDVINGFFPESEYNELSNASHWLHAEQPRAFLASCENFLSHAH